MEATQLRQHEQLVSIAAHAQDVLITAHTVWPFKLFTDTVTVDRLKVTIHKRTFFFSADVVSVQIEDILNVEVDSGPFLATLKIHNRLQAVRPPLRIDFLPKKEAEEIKTIIQGYSIARIKEIDCSNIPRSQLLPLLEQLGHEIGG